MADFKAAKVVAAVPTPPEADTVYFVRTGAGFDLYITNGIGTVTSYKLNGLTIEDLESKADLNATATKSGGLKVWLDSADNTLYITNNGDDADDI